MSKWITNGFVPASRKKGLENKTDTYSDVYIVNKRYVHPWISVSWMLKLHDWFFQVDNIGLVCVT